MAVPGAQVPLQPVASVQPMMQQQMQPVMMMQPMQNVGMSVFVLGPDPTPITCPNCKAQIVTNVEYQNGTLTWILVGGLCLFGCWLGCCLIPTCTPSCQDAMHRCPNCQTFVGRYRRL